MSGYDGRGRKFPLVIARGTDVAFELTATDSAGAPVDMSSATIAGNIYTKAGTLVDTMTAAVSGAGSNVVTLSLSDTKTALLTSVAYQWSLLVTRGGDVRPWLAGGVTVVDPDTGGTGTSGNTVVSVDDDVNVAVTVAVVGDNDAAVPLTPTGVAATDTATLQAALTAGGIVALEAFSAWIVDDTLVMPSDTELHGNSASITAEDAMSAPLFTNASVLNGNSGIVLRDLFLDGNGATAVADFSVIDMSRVSDSYFVNLDVRGAMRAVAFPDGTYGEGLLLRYSARCHVVGGRYHHNSYDGIKFRATNYSTVSDATCDENGRAGIQISFNSPTGPPFSENENFDTSGSNFNTFSNIVVKHSTGTPATGSPTTSGFYIHTGRFNTVNGLVVDGCRQGIGTAGYTTDNVFTNVAINMRYVDKAGIDFESENSDRNTVSSYQVRGISGANGVFARCHASANDNRIIDGHHDDGAGTGSWVTSVGANNEATNIKVTTSATGLVLAADPVPATVPSAPWLLNSTAGDNQISLSWANPLNDGGAARTGFIVDYKESSSGTWVRWPNPITTASVVITGLSAVPHDMRVAAVNIVGTSAWSTTDTETPTTPTTYYDEVMADSPVAFYRLDDSASPAVDSTGTTTQASIAGVTFGTADIGDGASSATVSGASSSNGIVLNTNASLGDVVAIEGLVNFASPLKDNATIGGVGGTGFAQRIFLAQSGGRIVALMIDAADGIRSIGGVGPVITAGTTYHFACSWDGSTLRAYVNGTAVNAGAAAASIKTVTTPNAGVGRRVSSFTDGAMNGTIAGVAFYTTAPSAARFLAHAQAAGVV
jgi:hypothetical protein